LFLASPLVSWAQTEGSAQQAPAKGNEAVNAETTPGKPRAPSVAPPGTPWVVNSLGQIYRGDGRSWQLLPGQAADVGAGAEGSVWVIGSNPMPGGFGIWRLAASGWVQVDGGAVRIAVDGQGVPWVVNAQGRIYRRAGDSWQELPGRAVDIGVGANGEAWVIGIERVAGGGPIFRWNGADWSRTDGAGVRIAVGPDGTPWVANSEGRIYRRQPGGWLELPGRARDVAVSASGTAWVIGATPTPGGHSIHYWDGQASQRVEGGGVSIAAR
jgi:hypothetical protein